MNLPVLAIACGLGCAICHSVSYIFSRLGVTRAGLSPWQRFLAAHSFMGIIGVAMLPLVWRPDAPPLSQYALPLGLAAGFYVIGQGAFFLLNRYVPPSLASPLLGFKIIVVAFLSSGLFGAPLTPLQWVAVILAAVATYVLNSSGGKLPLRALGILLVACLGYACSDVSISRLVLAMEPVPRVAASLMGVSLKYTGVGLLALLYALGTKPRVIYRDPLISLGFAVAWMGAMVFLFITIATGGVVLAVILQALRGLVSLGLALLLAKAGMHALEPAATPHAMAHRLGGAIMMFAAIVLYVVGA